MGGHAGGCFTCFDGSRFSTLTIADGLASDAVLRVFQDSNGYMWFATWGGLNRYDGEVFQILTQEDGLASSAVMKFFEEEDGRLWFATGSGATCCRLPVPSPPPVYIRAVVADRRYTSLDAISIPSSAGLTAVEFHGINFKTRLGAMIYRYRLKGHSEDWKTTRARRVEYQDLEPGSYLFQVVAVDRDLNYSMPVEVTITVTHDVRDERIDELESRVRERTQELLSKNKELEQTLVQLRDAQNQLVVQEKDGHIGQLGRRHLPRTEQPVGGSEERRRRTDQRLGADSQRRGGQ